MNLDLSIHHLAFREADTLGQAQVLVAKKRQDVELEALRKAALAGTDTQKSREIALEDLMAQSRRLPEPAPVELRGLIVDKTA